MQALGASELIINDRGAIYHLNVRPEEIADTIITVGDPERVAEVSKYFDRIEHTLAHREFITHTGFIGQKRISVLSTGIGPDNIDIALNEIDALVNIDFTSRTIHEQKKSVSIIRMGTCGSLQGEVGVNELVAGTHGLGIDNVLHFYTQENNEEETRNQEIVKALTGRQKKEKPYRDEKGRFAKRPKEEKEKLTGKTETPSAFKIF